MLKKIGLLFIGGALMFVLAACGEAEVSKVDKEKPAETEGTAKDKEKEAPKQDKFSIGDTVNFDGLEITLNEVRIEQGGDFDTPENDKFLVVNLTAENTTDEEQIVSSIMNVELKDADGYSYTTTILLEGTKGQFDGTVEVGGKLRGEIPFDVSDSETYELSFSDLFKSGKAIWVISADEL